jgi:hyperosmotically inducible periplasmic protein
MNQQDRQKNSVTADQQNQNLTDWTLTQQIRKALMRDKTLSTNAHNVKIASQNGA